MIKKLIAMSAVVLAGALTFAGVARSTPFNYSANFCSPAKSGNTATWSKAASFATGTASMDIVCPFVLSGTADVNFTKLRYRSSSVVPGGTCSAITVSGNGSSVGFVSVNLTTSPNFTTMADFGTVEASAATSGYIACTVPPGTALYSYFTNQP
jgi:hypothetical protein